MERLLSEGVTLGTLYQAQRFWADAFYGPETNAKQAQAEAVLRAHGWFWPEEPPEEVFEVARPDLLPAWALAEHFPENAKAQPWRDVGCAACGATAGEPCRGRFEPKAEPFHKARAEAAREVWEGQEAARVAAGIGSADLGAKLGGYDPGDEREAEDDQDPGVSGGDVDQAPEEDLDEEVEDEPEVEAAATGTQLGLF